MNVKIRKGDTVEIISGRLEDKGKRGEVINVLQHSQQPSACHEKAGEIQRSALRHRFGNQFHHAPSRACSNERPSDKADGGTHA